MAGDPVNNSGASNFGCQTPQNETTIAVDPNNPQHLVAGANDYRVCCDFTGLNDATGGAYTSFDGGATWTNTMVPGLTAETGGQGQFKNADSAGDPAMSIGPDGYQLPIRSSSPFSSRPMRPRLAKLASGAGRRPRSSIASAIVA